MAVDNTSAQDNRIKGQDVTILIAQDGNLLDELNDINDFEFTDLLEIITKGYLGQKSEKKDTVYKGVKGSFSLDLSSKKYFTFRQAVLNKAKRITPDVTFNVSGVFSFPNGDTPTITFLDVQFGNLPVNVKARGDYVPVKLDFECEDSTVQGL